ncbi:Asp/Glu/Hydantoin racemase [Pseudidiomarina planktonica]|uniref:Asp/Glu/Hydantoin racemase n=1 Tax=Pseudidiomarina planktonica TaxID=1323738 RepID=A0A1Y6E8N0_9GAMM|nr:aspartate/glutamate racemase family protein [Pseudidiomarina planktonica]RUO66306.1 hypothetical protein CWI77_07755 [Pseudidiomarina planktonica]SMQ58968.1 Asp/Glu/Hydantoin racemase [Pseudidiomarina planktonica]
MKTIGLLGCMQWESTLAYYRAINQGIRDAKGGLHSAKLVMYSVDFAAVDRMQRGDDWDGISELLCEAERKQAKAGGGSKKEYLQVIEDLAEQGADAVILGSNDLCLLLAQTDTEVPLLNAVDIHATKAVNYALGDSTWARSTSHG